MIKPIIALLLFPIALPLTVLIWIFGGWTQGWDYMPNPVYGLLDWADF